MLARDTIQRDWTPPMIDRTRDAVFQDHPTGISLAFVNVTPDMALALLDLNTANRNTTQNHIDRLARDMRHGDFRATGDAIRIDWNGVLIDSQHRLFAIIESNTTQRMPIMWGLDPDTKLVIDDQKKRTGANAIEFAFGDKAVHTNIITSTARLDLNIDSMNGTASAIRMANTTKTSPSNTEVVRWVENNLDVLDVVSLSSKVAHSKHLTITPRFATWLYLQFHRVSPELAAEFFAPMLTNLGFTGQGDPRLTFLTAVNMMDNDDRRTLRTVVFGVRAWNLWRQGQTISQFRATHGRRNQPSAPAPLEKAI